ncbi:MAG: class I SAM-dependent methyltransferase [Ignavibacteriales bacterium]|nr:MAG: class I SAM-dependent methyltransferase [Ignavibacteriales bacterium]
MLNQNKWQPSKYVKVNGVFGVTNDETKVGLGYRFIGNIQAKHYSELIQKYAGGNLLDLGCGNVSLYEMYREKVDSIYCADWPNSFHDTPFQDFQLNLNNTFPIKNETFDTIILTDVMEHVANPTNLWKEMARVLRPNGKIIVGVPFFHIIHEEPYDYFRYTEYRLRLYCSENNLKILELYPYGGSLEILLDITAKHFSRIKIFSKIHYIFANLIINSFLGKKIFQLTALKYPLGYCMVIEK